MNLFHNFIQFAEISNQSAGTICFWNDEHGHSPFGGAAFGNDAKCELSLDFCFCCFHLVKEDGMWLFDVIHLCSKIQINTALKLLGESLSPEYAL